MSMWLRIVLGFGIITLLAVGCTSNYSPRADLSSVQTIGVVVPPDSSEPQDAKDIMQLYNLTVSEDRLKNSAAGAGSGAAVGAVAGVGAGAYIGCAAFTGPLMPACFGVLIASGAVVGGGAGAIAGATVDTQEQVNTAPLHLYEVNQVLPELTQEYLTSTVLQDRAMQTLHAQGTAINFVQAAWDGERYALPDSAEYMSQTTDINLVLSVMRVWLSGKAKDDPEVVLNVDMQWDLTKYNPETQSDEVWDAMLSSYESKRHRLSEWLAENGALLQTEVDRGIEHTLTNSFSELPGMTQ